MIRFEKFPLAALLVLLLSVSGCGTDTDTTPDDPDAPGAPANGLTAFEEEHGIGPFTEEVTLDEPVDPQMAAQGQEVFEFNCEACHMLDERFVGPALGEVLERRTPTFVMNFIMNPEEMAQRHPVGQELLQEFPIIMPYQNITEEQARMIVEYLRIAGADG